MLTVAGNLFIPTSAKISINKTEYGAFFQTIAVAKHPTKEEKLYYKVDIFVQAEFALKAADKIIPGAMIQVRHGDLLSKTFDGKDGPVIFNTVSTKWNWIEFLTKYPNKDKQIES